MFTLVSQKEQSEDAKQAEGVIPRWSASLTRYLEEMDKIRSAEESQDAAVRRRRHLQLKSAYHVQRDAKT